MKNNYVAAAGTAGLALVLVFCLAVGGCRETAPAGPDVSEAASTQTGKDRANPGCVEIGRDPGVVARLNAPARVFATLYPADGGRGAGEEVVLLPGTWLVPESAFPLPDAGGDDDDR